MTARTSDLPIKSRAGEVGSCDLAAATTLYAGVLICFDTSGNLVNAANTSGFTFAGIGRQKVDNSTGAAGDKAAEFYKDGEWRLTGTGFAATDVGEKVYAIDNQTVGLKSHASVTQFIEVGEITEYVDATHVWVRIKSAPPHQAQQFVLQIVGVNAADLDLSAVAAAGWGGSDIYVDAVQAIEAYVTGTLATPILLADTTDYTVAGGVISIVGDQSAKTLLVTCTGSLK